MTASSSRTELVWLSLCPVQVKGYSTSLLAFETEASGTNHFKLAVFGKPYTHTSFSPRPLGRDVIKRLAIETKEATRETEP